jgi:hypothetical protein
LAADVSYFGLLTGEDTDAPDVPLF